jgi:hypothetical protein
MAYKVKKSKARDYSQEELEMFRKKYHRNPNFFEATRVGMRKVSGVQYRIHKKGAMVTYDGRLAKIHKVTKKGLWIETFRQTDNDDFLESTGKIIFIPEKRVEHEVYPISTRFPVLEGLTLAV